MILLVPERKCFYACFISDCFFIRAVWGQLRSQYIHWKDTGFFRACDVQQDCLKHKCSVMNNSIGSTEASQHWKEFKICVRVNTKIKPLFKLTWILWQLIILWNIFLLKYFYLNLFSPSLKPVIKNQMELKSEHIYS